MSVGRRIVPACYILSCMLHSPDCLHRDMVHEIIRFELTLLQEGGSTQPLQTPHETLLLQAQTSAGTIAPKVARNCLCRTLILCLPHSMCMYIMCVYIYIHVCMYVCMYICMHIYTRTQMCVYLNP